MQIFDSFTEEQRSILAAVVGIMAIFTLVGFGYLAYLNSPDYDPARHTISKLGIQTSTGGLYFTIGMVVGGLLLFLFFWLYEDVFPFHSKRSFLNKEFTSWGHFLAKNGCFFLVLVGLFPDRGVTVIPHFIAAAAMFTSIGIAIFVWSLTILDECGQILPGAKLIAFFGFFTCFIAILHGFFSSLKIQGPIWQKIAVFFYITWFLIFNVWTWKIRPMMTLYE